MRRGLAGLLAGAALAGCGAGQPTGGQPTPAPVSAATSRAAAALAVRSFAIFRRATRRGDEIPPDQANGGVKPTLSRLAYAGPLGTLYAYVHGGLLCVSYATRVSTRGAGSASGACDSVAGAATTGMAAPISASVDRFDRIALLVPNGTRTVTLTRAGGGRTFVAVRDNAVVSAVVGLRGWAYTTATGLHESGVLARAPVAAPARRGP